MSCYLTFHEGNEWSDDVKVWIGNCDASVGADTWPIGGERKGRLPCGAMA